MNTPLECARLLADWYVNNQFNPDPHTAISGEIISYRKPGDPKEYLACQWHLAFALMGMLSAAKVFQDQKYQDAADRMARYLRTLQVFDPFLTDFYGAIREANPQLGTFFVRDSLSAAWAFLEYYEATGKEEFLQRAILWAKWFLAHGMDETGWPLWGYEIEPAGAKDAGMPLHNDIHGCFHGGCLTFFAKLAKSTGAKSWTGPFFEHIADYFCSTIQQADGFFRSVEKATGKVPKEDPQKGLHRGNDDLGTLGLLNAWKVYLKPQDLKAISRFIEAVFQKQATREDHLFEENCAAVPVILNIVEESRGIVDVTIPEQACLLAEQALLARQFPATTSIQFAGALDELNDGALCVRSMGYSLLWLLKKHGGDRRFLTLA